MNSTRGVIARCVLACFVAGLVFAPAATKADSNGVPFLAGTWHGTLKSKYWDQTVAGFQHPKNKFKTKVTVTIAQGQQDDALAVTITYDDGLPLDSLDSVGVSALGGFVGNFHLNLSTTGDLDFALSGDVNRKGNTIDLAGVAASDSLTHELTIKLKKQDN